MPRVAVVRVQRAVVVHRAHRSAFVVRRQRKLFDVAHVIRCLVIAAIGISSIWIAAKDHAKLDRIERQYLGASRSEGGR